MLGHYTTPPVPGRIPIIPPHCQTRDFNHQSFQIRTSCHSPRHWLPALARVDVVPGAAGGYERDHALARPRGSRASRRPSPTKLIASTAIVSVNPGVIASRGTVTKFG